MEHIESPSGVRASTNGQEADPATQDATLASALRDITHQAWIDTLGKPAADAQTWESAGGDSIMTLHLMLLLERKLGRPVTYDTLHGAMTADDMAGALQSQMVCRGDERPVLYLVPGVWGDALGLAEFRRAVATRVRCELVGLPDLETPAAFLQDMCASGRLIAEAIMRRAPSGNVMLGGYSFGGSLAMEAARHLISSGRTVSRLIVLDTLFHEAITAPVGIANVMRVLWSQSLWEHKAMLLLRLATNDRLRALLLRNLRWVAPRSESVIRYVLHGRFRVRAMRSWRPETLALPLLFVASDDSSADAVSRWRALCTGLEIVRVKGGHTELFTHPTLTDVSNAVTTAIQQSLSRHR